MNLRREREFWSSDVFVTQQSSTKQFSAWRIAGLLAGRPAYLFILCDCRWR